jgi:CheY-like chemotaxis protein
VQNRQTPCSAREIRLLVVDDEPFDVELLRNALALAGESNITHICDGSQALEMVTNGAVEAFDLILLDWSLPGISGEQIARAYLERTNLKARVPVVILSNALPGPIDSALRAMGAITIQKPLSLDGYSHLASQIFDLCRDGGPTGPAPD